MTTYVGRFRSVRTDGVCANDDDGAPNSTLFSTVHVLRFITAIVSPSHSVGQIRSRRNSNSNTISPYGWTHLRDRAKTHH